MTIGPTKSGKLPMSYADPIAAQREARMLAEENMMRAAKTIKPKSNKPKDAA